MCDAAGAQAMGFMGSAISSFGGSGDGGYANRVQYAEINEANSKKAYYRTLSDLTAKGQQEAGMIADNAERIMSKFDKRGALETVSAGENNVEASKMDNIRAALKTEVAARTAMKTSRRNINTMARESHTTMESRINQGWSGVGAPPAGPGLGEFLSLAGALIEMNAGE